MADLDTRSKRASSVGLLLAFVLAPPLPDATLDQGDRQHIARSYSGVLAAAPVTLQYVDWIKRTNRINWYGLEFNLRREFLGWQLHSGSVYYTEWPEAGRSFELSEMRENGVALTQGSNSTLSAGQWWQDRSVKPKRTYLRTSDSSNPYSKTIIGHFTDRYCGGTPVDKVSSDLNGKLWRPYVIPSSIPVISQAIGNVLYGTVVLGTVKIALQNADGYFDSYYEDWLWKDSTCSFLHGDGGAEQDGQPGLSYDQHRLISLVCSNVEINERELVITFETPIHVIGKPALRDYFDIEDYPNMDPALQGKWIPEFYGAGEIPFYPIDTNLGIFKGTGRALHSISKLELGDQSVGFTTDLANATVTVTENLVLGVTATAKSGGSLSAGDYFVRVAALLIRQVRG